MRIIDNGPVIAWRPVQGVPRLLPDNHWDRLQPPSDPTDRLSGYRKWMDGSLIKTCLCPSFMTNLQRHIHN